MAEKEKNIKAETTGAEVMDTGEATEKTTLTEAQNEKTGLWSWIKERSVPVKIVLGVVSGAVVTGIVLAGKAVIDMLTSGDAMDDTEESEESCETEAPKDE